MFDTHAHLNDRAFKNDIEGVLTRAADAGVDRVICPGYDLTSSRRAVEIAGKFDNVWAAVGVHPHDAKSLTDETIAELRMLAAMPKVIAIGEIGLDFYRDLSPRAVQEQALRSQLGLAKQLGLPVIVHDREAGADILRVIEDEGPPDAGGVMHCFSGDLDQAESVLALGFYLGFAGPVTFDKSRNLREVARSIPIGRLLIETDSPYLTPEPYRGRRTNEPAFARVVAEKVAEVRGVDLEEIAGATSENTLRLFEMIGG